ncbi:universal stress protein [Kitasatospora sp. NPDC090091]|uniref:universal stress protein n=1 Tax=Kitasatospora sp. NPDC090091 TaxID=3364081 RepID=UPI00381681E2
MAADGGRRPVVLGVDATEPESAAVVWAADEAGMRRLPLRLVHAVEPMEVNLRGFDESHRHRRLRERGDEALAKALALVRDRQPDVDAATVLADDLPAPALCEESQHAELVVLGSRRMSRLDELLSSYSVAVPLAAQSDCPVVVVRETGHGTTDRPVVVAGFDASPESRAALDVAADLAARRGARLRVVQVWSPPLLRSGEQERHLAELDRVLAEALAARAADHPAQTLSHETVPGHPVEELAKASEQALAVVVGRRGHGGFTGMRLGSVPHGLLHHAHCPVVVVPPPEGTPKRPA